MENIDFDLPTNSYAGFDAATLRQLIINNLQDSDLFKDANFEGSNISSLISIIAYSNHLLLWYLNNTSSESNFSYASLYENINKLVKIMNYNPIGRQTAVLSFNAIASANLAIGNYFIPRFSYVTSNGINYSLSKNFTITKTLSGAQELTGFSDEGLLYQGKFKQYPLQTTVGEDYEVITIGLKSTDVIIDHNNIYVFVKEGDSQWIEYNRVDSIYNENSNSLAFEARFNEYQLYEIKFGNDVNGKKPIAGSSVVIYYLASDGAAGELDANALDRSKLFLNQDTTFLEIFNDTVEQYIGSFSLIDSTDALEITFSNDLPSTSFAEIETVESIKNNASNFYKNQYRLVNESDYETMIQFKYSNIISSIKAISNKTYIGDNGHLYYLKSLGLTQANQDNKILSNQVLYSDSCDFNNVYLYGVPKFANTYDYRPTYLTNSQKNSIIDDISSLGYLNSEIVFVDPVYMAFRIGYTEDITKTYNLIINKTPNSFVNTTNMRDQILNIFIEYFSSENNSLGKYVDLTEISQKILSISGISSIQTSDGYSTVDGISFQYYDPSYKNVIYSTNQNLQLEYFKYPCLENVDQLQQSIIIQ